MSIEQGDVARAMSTDNPLIMRQFTAEAPISIGVRSLLFKNMSEPTHVSDLLDGKLFCTRVDILRSLPHPAGDDEEGVFKSVIAGRIVDEEPVIGKPIPDGERIPMTVSYTIPEIYAGIYVFCLHSQWEATDAKGSTWRPRGDFHQALSSWGSRGRFLALIETCPFLDRVRSAAKASSYTFRWGPVRYGEHRLDHDIDLSTTVFTSDQLKSEHPLSVLMTKREMFSLEQELRLLLSPPNSSLQGVPKTIHFPVGDLRDIIEIKTWDGKAL